MKKALLTLSVVTSGIAFASAQNAQVNGAPLIQLLNVAQDILSRLVPFAITLAVVVFFWFLIQFIWKGSADPKERTESLKGMGWSIVALFVMVSIWGIVGFLASVTGIGQGGTIPIPSVPRPK